MRVRVLPELAGAWSPWCGHSELAPWRLQVPHLSLQQAETLGTVLLLRTTVWRCSLEMYNI